MSFPLDPMHGRIVTAKTPSAPADPSRSFVAGIGRALDQAGMADAAIPLVLHGTTVATNLILGDRAFSRFGSLVIHNRSKGRGAALPCRHSSGPLLFQVG